MQNEESNDFWRDVLSMRDGLPFRCQPANDVASAGPALQKDSGVRHAEVASRTDQVERLSVIQASFRVVLQEHPEAVGVSAHQQTPSHSIEIHVQESVERAPI